MPAADQKSGRGQRAGKHTKKEQTEPQGLQHLAGCRAKETRNRGESVDHACPQRGRRAEGEAASQVRLKVQVMQRRQAEGQDETRTKHDRRKRSRKEGIANPQRRAGEAIRLQLVELKNGALGRAHGKSQLFHDVDKMRAFDRQLALSGPRQRLFDIEVP